MPDRHYPLEAFCPRTNETVSLRITAATARDVSKYGPPKKFYELCGDATPADSGSCVQDVLRSPSAIYEGVRDYQEGGTCYCGTPTCSWTNGGARCPPHPKKLFAVYVNPRGEVYTWRWITADPRDPRLPEDTAGFREREHGRKPETIRSA